MKADILKRSRRSKLHRSQTRFVWLVLTPILLYLGVFVLFPFASSFHYSLRDFFWDEFVGFANYKEALFDDYRVREAFLNTFKYALIRIPPTIILGFLLAVVLNKIVVGRGGMIFGFFAPYITNIVAYSAVFLYLFSSAGLFNVFLEAVGLPAQPFIRGVGQALPAVALMDAFKHIGFDVLIFMAALQNIPNTIYDAARIDGASQWQATRHITIPLMRPTFLFLIVIITIWTTQVFEPVYVMTGGGPMGATRTVVYSIWGAAFGAGRVGYAAALSIMLFVVIGLITIIQLRIGQTRWEY